MSSNQDRRYRLQAELLKIIEDYCRIKNYDFNTYQNLTNKVRELDRAAYSAGSSIYK